MPEFITTRVDGLQDLETALLGLPDKLARKALKNAADKSAALFVAAAREHIHNITGKLSAALDSKVTSHAASDGGTVTATIGIDTKKSRIGHLVEFGTKPHTVKVNRAKVLASANAIFGRKVQHPGARPAPFMRPAWEQDKDAALVIFQYELAAQIESLGTKN